MHAIEKELILAFRDHVPTDAIARIFAHWTFTLGVQVKITPHRSTKRGDYRAPHGKHGHRISINGTLNPYAFMVTFIHEMAHLQTWVKFNSQSIRVAPHGPEWQRQFQLLMQPFLKNGHFPSGIQEALSIYMRKPAASSCRDEDLMNALRAYDPPLPAGLLLLADLPENAFFQIENGQVFKKGKLRRKYYACTEWPSGRHYGIGGQLVVNAVDIPQK